MIRPVTSTLPFAGAARVLQMAAWPEDITIIVHYICNTPCVYSLLWQTGATPDQNPLL